MAEPGEREKGAGRSPPPQGALPPEVTIGPPKGLEPLGLGELWRARELGMALAARDVAVRYQQTVLGVAWAVLQPLMMMGVFSLVLGRLAKLPSGDVPYPLFVFAGLLPWMLFSTAVTGASGSVIGAERLVTKVYFPRLLIPLSAVASSLVDFGCGYAVLIVLVLGNGLLPGPGALMALVPALFVALAAAGAGSVLAALNVWFRDFRYIVPFLVQLGMFGTPTIYMDVSKLPPDGAAAWLIALNPLNGLVEATRDLALGSPVDWWSFGASALAASLIFLSCCFAFRQVEPRFSDVI